jgi:hypothetical protein
MPMSSATSREQMPSNDYVVAGPRKSDPISGALRAAFAHLDEATDDFAVLLRRIDVADRAIASC